MSSFRTLLTQPTVWASIAIGVVFLAVWEWVPAAMGVPSFVIPPVSEVWDELVYMFNKDRLMHHTGVTGVSILIGFVIGSALGAAIGYALAASPAAEVALSPYILALQIAPKVAFAPLFILWFGFNMWPKILVAVLIVFFPVLVNVLSAVRNIDRDMINLARAFNASRLEIFTKIEVPASMPPLFSGLRIASTLAIIGVIVGELFGGNSGLGYMLSFAQGQANTRGVFALIFVLTVLGLIAYFAVVFVESRVLHYLPKRDFSAR